MKLFEGERIGILHSRPPILSQDRATVPVNPIRGKNSSRKCDILRSLVKSATVSPIISPDLDFEGSFSLQGDLHAENAKTARAIQAHFTIEPEKLPHYHVQTEGDLEKRGVLARASRDVRVLSVRSATDPWRSPVPCPDPQFMMSSLDDASPHFFLVLVGVCSFFFASLRHLSDWAPREAEHSPVHLHDVFSQLPLVFYELEKGRITIWACILHRDYASHCQKQSLSIAPLSVSV